MKVAELAEQLVNLTVLELQELKAVLKDKYGIEAAIATAAVAPVEEAPAEVDVILEEAGSQKIAVIKAVKDLTGVGLGEAKAIVDDLPKTILEKVPREEADKARKTLEDAGAIVR